MEYYWKRKFYTNNNFRDPYSRLERINQLSKEMKAPLVDRTGTIDNSYKILTPIPEVSAVPLIFSEVCDERANFLLAKSQDENKELRLSWSGGIDSTTALVAVLRFIDNYPGADLKVCLNERSIDEYPDFYEEFIKDKLDVYEGIALREVGEGENHSLGLNFSRDTGKDYFLVTGEIGDQIFGAKKILNSLEDASKDYKEIFSAATVNLIKPLVAKMPVKWGDENCGNVLAWLNFVMKYQWCQLRMYMMFDVPWDKYQHFFDTTEFQQWCMDTPPIERWPDWDKKRYKIHAKEYIRDFDGNELYFREKEKVPSMRQTMLVPDHLKEDPNTLKSLWVSIDENFVKGQKHYYTEPKSVEVVEIDGSIEITLNEIVVEM